MTRTTSALPTSSTSSNLPTQRTAVPVAVIGGGPAGLMAAQELVQAGHAVHVFDAMPSVGRKFLLAGKGGLNLTHSEGPDTFAGRYGARRAAIESLLHGFGPEALRAWAEGLGVETFVGTSGRVFPKDMKAAPLLRAWLQRLRRPPGLAVEENGGPDVAGGAGALGSFEAVGVRFHMRHRWTGWVGGQAPAAGQPHRLAFVTPHGTVEVEASAVVLALGGGSWARLGSDGAWVTLLAQQGVAVAPLLPSNCGFDVQPSWTEFFATRFAGQPFKSVAISVDGGQGRGFSRKGEFVATATGVEGSVIYAASGLLRDAIARDGRASFKLDLLPDMPLERVLAEVQHPRGTRSLASHLKSRLRLDGIKSAILHELLPKDAFQDATQLATAIKGLTITLGAARPIDEAISSAGGVLFEVLTPELMLGQLPGVFCAGEMLDWEAPTGGYLLQASFATGYRAGQGAARYLAGLGS